MPGSRKRFSGCPRFFLVACLGLAASGQALAESPGEIPGFSLHAGFSLTDFDYEEFLDDATTANREDGTLPGIMAGAGYRKGKWFAGLDYSRQSGEVDYRGPARSDTGELITEWAFLAGRELYRSGPAGVSVLAGAGYREWQRDIQSTPVLNGLFEVYDWWYWVVGLKGDYRLGGSTTLTLDAALRRPVDPVIDVEFVSDFDDARLDLGEENGYRVALGLEYQASRTMAVRLSAWYEYWELGRSDNAVLRSDGIPVGTVFEPESETGNSGLGIGISWRPR